MCDLLDIGDDEKEENWIVGKFDILTSSINPEVFCDKLREAKYLSSEDVEEVNCIQRYPGRKRRAGVLLEALITKGPHAIQEFRKLLQYEYPHIYRRVTGKMPEDPPSGYKPNPEGRMSQVIEHLPNIIREMGMQQRSKQDILKLLELAQKEKEEQELELLDLRPCLEENKTLTVRIEDLRIELCNVNGELKNRETKYIHCLQEKDELNTKLIRIMTEKERLFVNNQSLRNELNGSNGAQSVNYPDDFYENQSEVEKENADYNQLKHEHNLLQKELDQVKSEREKLREEKRDVKRRNADLYKQINDLHKLSNERLNDRKRAEDKYRKLKDETNLKTADLHEECNKYVDENLRLQTALDDIRGVELNRFEFQPVDEPDSLSDLKFDITEDGDVKVGKKNVSQTLSMKTHYGGSYKLADFDREDCSEKDIASTSLETKGTAKTRTIPPPPSDVKFDITEDSDVKVGKNANVSQSLSMKTHYGGSYKLADFEIEDCNEKDIALTSPETKGTTKTKTIPPPPPPPPPPSVPPKSDSVPQHTKITNFIPPPPSHKTRANNAKPFHKPPKPLPIMEKGVQKKSANDPFQTSNPSEDKPAKSDPEDKPAKPVPKVPQGTPASDLTNEALPPSTSATSILDHQDSNDACVPYEEADGNDGVPHEVADDNDGVPYEVADEMLIPVERQHTGEHKKEVGISQDLFKTIEIIGGNATGIFVSNIAENSQVIHVHDEVLQLRCTVGNVKNIEYFEYKTLKEARGLLSRYQKMSIRDIFVTVHQNIEDDDSKDVEQAENNNHRDYFYVRSNTISNGPKDTISLDRWNLYLVTDTTLDNSFYEARQINRKNGRHVSENPSKIPSFSYLQQREGKFLKLSSKEDLFKNRMRRRDGKEAECSYVKVIPTRAAANFPVLLFGNDALVHAVVEILKDCDFFETLEYTNHSDGSEPRWLDWTRKDKQVVLKGEPELVSKCGGRAIYIGVAVDNIYQFLISMDLMQNSTITRARQDVNADVPPSYTEQLDLSDINDKVMLVDRFKHVVSDAQSELFWFTKNQLTDLDVVDKYKGFLAEWSEI